MPVAFYDAHSLVKLSRSRIRRSAFFRNARLLSVDCFFLFLFFFGVGISAGVGAGVGAGDGAGVGADPPPPPPPQETKIIIAKLLKISFVILPTTTFFC